MLLLLDIIAYTSTCVVLVLVVGTTRAACAAACPACYTARCYCILLAVRMRVRRAAACYTYSRATCGRLLLALGMPNEVLERRVKKRDAFARI